MFPSTLLRRASALAIVLVLAAAPSAAQREGEDPQHRAVKAVGPLSLTVSTPQGSGSLRYFSNGSLDGSSQAVRALIVIHGLQRDADVYERIAEAVIARAGESSETTLLVTPQFLAHIDVAGDALPPDTLRWNVGSWIDGEPARAPAPVSAFSVLDELLARLGDRTRFPHLREIVIAGHSAGGQLVQRYAVVGQAPDKVASESLTVRFVTANPSSYLYFTPDRPAGNGFAPVSPTACPGYNNWKYGVNDPPPYVRGSVAAMESPYVARNVTYMLGLLDTDPNHPVLDKSCAGEAEGPYRLARGRSYIAYLKQRHPGGTGQSFAEVAGVDHSASGMFSSACGIAVLFNRPRGACAAAGRV